MNDKYPHFAVVPGERLRLLRVLTIGYSSAIDAALHHTGLNLHRRIILDSIAPRAYATPGRWPWNTSGPAPPPPDTTAEPFQPLSPIYPLVAAISNKDNTPWLAANQSDNLVLLDTIRAVPGEEEIWIDVGWSTGGAFGGEPDATTFAEAVASTWLDATRTAQSCLA